MFGTRTAVSDSLVINTEKILPVRREDESSYARNVNENKSKYIQTCEIFACVKV